MERSQSVFGLVKQLVMVRWQALSPRGRMGAVVVSLGLAGAAAVGAHAMTGQHACCAGGCPAARARAEAAAAAADGSGEMPPCHAHD